MGRQILGVQHDAALTIHHPDHSSTDSGGIYSTSTPTCPHPFRCFRFCHGSLPRRCCTCFSAAGHSGSSAEEDRPGRPGRPGVFDSERRKYRGSPAGHVFGGFGMDSKGFFTEIPEVENGFDVIIHCPGTCVFNSKVHRHGWVRVRSGKYM